MKFNKLAFLSIFCLLSLSLASCGNKNDVSYTLLAPTGAPTLSIYGEILKENSTTTSTTTNIPVELQKGSYDFVVFDTINALKLIYNQKKADYTLLKTLTFGNFHIAGFNKQEGDLPKAGDRIVSFNQGGITTEVFDYLYPELKDSVEYVSSVSDVAPILKAGTYDNQSVDWCFVAEPVLTNVMNQNNNDDNETNDILDIDVNDLLKEKSSGKIDFIPQAGLFVKNDFLANNESFVTDFLTEISKQNDDAINNIDKVKEAINGASENVKLKFGYTVDTLDLFGSEAAKKFGLRESKFNLEIEEINAFLNTIGSSTSIEYSHK